MQGEHSCIQTPLRSVVFTKRSHTMMRGYTGCAKEEELL